MCYIYAADIFCDDCGDKIKDAIFNELRAGDYYPDGAKVSEFSSRADRYYHLVSMDECSYDSEEYPKGCAGSSESDSPQHCGDCGEFLENDLTSDGADYVVATVREDLESGHHDSIACTVWREYYTWLDFPVWGICDDCGEEGFLDSYDVCEGACAWEG